MTKKIILHLCASKFASDSREYANAGYDVRVVDKDIDVRRICPQGGVYGVIANPPCTDFAGSGARWWAVKGDRALMDSLALVDACCRSILFCSPKFWIIENPVGRLIHYLGKPRMYYQPYEYGDPWTKKTCLWGHFNMPVKNPVKPTMGSIMHRLAPSPDRADKRSICSPGFAKAFFEANK